MLVELIIMANLEKQYYQFTQPGTFGTNAIFEKEGNNFKPILGRWDENSFRQLTGKSFKDVMTLNTSIDDILKNNPTYKQNGAITNNSNYEIYGKIKAKNYDLIDSVFQRIKPTTKYKFNFENQFDTGLNGGRLALTSTTDPAYKDWVEKNKAITEGTSARYKDYHEIKINPDMPEVLVNHAIVHEIAHTIFENKTIPSNLFNENRTSMAGGGLNEKARYINKDETIADHFADYINYPDRYRLMYPKEYKWFNNNLK